jgi:hypothetical protein
LLANSIKHVLIGDRVIEVAQAKMNIMAVVVAFGGFSGIAQVVINHPKVLPWRSQERSRLLQLENLETLQPLQRYNSMLQWM